MMVLSPYAACVLLALVSLAHFIMGQDLSSLPAEARLVGDLMKHAEKFGKYVRPVNQPDVAVNVSFGLRVVKIGVHTQQSQLTVTAWCRLHWFDENLTWNASDYSGIDRIYLPIQKMWTPDITLVNSAVALTKEEDKAMLSVHSDGYVFWSPLRIFNVPCLITLQDYPWDEYSCDMWFQSIAYSSNFLNPQLYYHGSSTPFELDTYLGNFRESDEWEIVQNMTAEVEQPCMEGVILMYSRRKSLRMTLTLRRRTGFMTLLLTIPCMVFGIMSCLIFCIPPTRPDRLAFGNGLFSTFMVFMLILAASVPPTSGAFPKLGIFYGFNSLLIILAIFLSIISITISKRGESGAKVPAWIDKSLVRTLGPILLVYPPSSTTDTQHTTTKGHEAFTFSEAQAQGTSKNRVKSTIAIKSKCHQCHLEKDSILCNLEEVSQKVTSIKEELNRLCSLSRVSTDKQWQNLAAILDRLLAVIYCIAFAIGLALLFPWPKQH